jgi:hypothetical protein
VGIQKFKGIAKKGPTGGVANFKNSVKLVVKGHRWRCL